MDDLSPIFILSCERSGSTLLHYILDTHPEISCPGELFLGQLSKLLRLAVSRTTGYVTLGSLEERDETARREVYKILTDLLGKFTKARGKKIWCEKTPYNVNDLTHLDWAFPQARYILLFRQSLDVVQSCLDMPEKSYLWWSLPYVVKQPNNYLAALLENWVEKNENILAFERTHPKSCRIQYEALVENPVLALDPVFKFLGLEWDPSLLDIIFSVPHDPGGGDSKITLTHKIEKDRVGRGASLDPLLLALAPPSLWIRQKALHRELGYAETLIPQK